MYYDDDDDYLYNCYDDDDNDNVGNVNINYIPCAEKKEYKPSNCRSCGYHNPYAEPDNIVDDNCHTCWRCVNHPERRLKGIPYDKRKEFDKYYEKAK